MYTSQNILKLSKNMKGVHFWGLNLNLQNYIQVKIFVQKKSQNKLIFIENN